AARADLSQLPAIQRFLQQMEARPAYQRAVERAGPLTPMR
ncbi:MAG TPA: glutathione S-transferase, partial [Alcanivorax sp.]|nr:glutathione S-transferase [Alcanivorax sp.]